jgi:AraC-like DNA-binding protein
MQVSTTFEFNDILNVVILVQLLLFSVYLLTQKKGKLISNKILAVFLFSKSLVLINFLLYRFSVRSPHVYFILIPFAFLYGPPLFLYVKSLVYKNFALKKWDALHLVPFALCSGYFIYLYHLRSTATKVRILTAAVEQTRIEEIIIIGSIHLQIICYLIAAVLTLLNYRSEFKKIYSNTGRMYFSWLNFVLFGYILIWIVDVSIFILDCISIPASFLNSLALVLTFIYANIIVYKGLKQPEIFNGIEKRPKYTRSKLTQPEKATYLKKLESYMQQEKPYLISSLTINDLGKKVSTPPRYLSQIINESLGKNFFDFVNSYRVEEAKKMLQDSSNSRFNIMELLFEVGFNTKSVFNRVFKNHTGMTPTEYKKIHQD